MIRIGVTIIKKCDLGSGNQGENPGGEPWSRARRSFKSKLRCFQSLFLTVCQGAFLC